MPIATNIYPRQCAVTVVVGKPILCPKDEQPSPATVRDLAGLCGWPCERVAQSEATLPRDERAAFSWDGMPQVQRYLELYIAGLTELYEDNRAKYNVPSTKPALTVI